MVSVQWPVGEIALAALYLAGGPPVGSLPRRWPAVLSLLRLRDARLGEAASILRQAGLWAEALVLETPGRVAWAEAEFSRGRVLTAASPAYPARWLAMGAGGPAALNCRGEMPCGPFVGVVGSRRLSAEDRRFAAAVAESAAAAGFALVSGGAIGADRAAARSVAAIGGGIAEIFPSGLRFATRLGGACALSLCAWDEPFSPRRAMERNAVIYSLADATVVVRARFREGGTWHGAVGALRRRARVLVRPDSGCPAARALLALGAEPLSSAAELAGHMAAPPMGRLSLVG
ncbi:MAG TPA: DNA-processing protein DprA [Fimbriimonadaceae bacterium]|nr:DNA-processing protein DprA [Fimbriimonadaceae bacterium]